MWQTSLSFISSTVAPEPSLSAYILTEILLRLPKSLLFPFSDGEYEGKKCTYVSQPTPAHIMLFVFIMAKHIHTTTIIDPLGINIPTPG